MMTKWQCLSAFGVGGLVLAATLVHADLEPAVVTNLTGTLRIQQVIPCTDDVDQTTPVNGGRLELSPSEGINVTGGGKFFTLTRANVSFAPFSITRSCLTFSETRSYTEARVQLARTVGFTASPTATPGVFSVLIPKAAFYLYTTAIANGTLETGYKTPIEDVTGTINLAAGTMQMRVVLGTRVHFEAGCVPLVGCAVNDTTDGTLTANISGTILFPDADADGVADRSDNCRFVANADQTPVPTPSITPPPNVTLPSCLSRNFGVAAAADVCDGGPVTIMSNAPLVFDVGANLITWTARDTLNRTATANQTVTVVDTTAPNFTFVPPDVFLNDCGPANLGQPIAVDDCAGTPVLTNNAPPKFFVGVTPVTWTATDAAGNQKTAGQNVTVVDTVPPTVFCVPTNPTGTTFRVSAIDSCTAAPVIRLGTFLLNEGEMIMINETGQPGIFLHNVVGLERIRQFHVGRGEAVLTAVDESGNVGTVACSVPR